MNPCLRERDAGELSGCRATGPKFWLEVIAVDLGLWVGLIYGLRLTF